LVKIFVDVLKGY